MLQILQIFPFSCYFPPFRPKDLPRNPVLRCPQPLFFPLYDRLSDTPIKYNGQNYTSAHFNLYISG